jgi:epoxyqueuosine reductase
MIYESLVSQQLLTELTGRGYQGRVVSIRHLAELQEEIDTHRCDGRLDAEFDRLRLSFFRYSPPETLREAQSLIIVAVPRPQTMATFTWQGQRLSLIIPPTYTDHRKIAQRTEDLIATILKPAGYKVALSLLPLKSLAAHSGLATYGRNNICYVPGMGSFLELVGLYSDLPCSEDAWQEVQMLKLCRHCRACLRHCPVGAIIEERFLIHAERCLSFHNEQPGNIPFPFWLNPTWHNCLEGCMLCQRACPENKDFLEWVEEREEFYEEETNLIMQGVSPDHLAQETLDKLARLDILVDLEILPRNLGVFWGVPRQYERPDAA